ncbi:MAG: peptide chain release factor N(5)-glutamine methyltransferase [Treponema sp.]|nr:peptide chain release factor N(5)-glutamine methyltransferase [Treponema sp.]
MTIHDARLAGIKQLVSSPTPALDVDCLLEYVTHQDRTHLLLNRQNLLSDQQQHDFDAALAKRQTGLPIAYIVGHKEFYGYDFTVSPAVLIPKPDTELLVEHAIAEVASRCTHHTSNIAFSLLDVCTGSACIGISIIKQVAELYGITGIQTCLTDISNEALAIAKINAARLLDTHAQVQFVQGDLLEHIQQEYPLIVTNPPYIPHDEVTELLRDGRGEPRLALDGDVGDNFSTDGLAIIRRLIPQVYEHLQQGGLFLIETGEYNAIPTADLMRQQGFKDVQTFCDLAGQLRLTQGRK